MRRVVGLLALLGIFVANLAGVAIAQDAGVSGRISYTGDLGPVRGSRPLCLCIYGDPELRDLVGCLIRTSNNASYSIPVNAEKTPALYLVAFLDIHINERIDPDEPFEIYSNRFSAPADAISTSPFQRNIDLVFGDESLAPPTASATPEPSLTPTASSTATPSETPSPTATDTPTATEVPTDTPEPTPTVTATVPPCAGDCDLSGAVTIDEILTLVNAALGNRPVGDCPSGDSDETGGIEVHEIVGAIAHALDGCG